jgi:type I restriction enzyme S subunit
MSRSMWEWLPLHEVAPEVKGSTTCVGGTKYELWSVPSFATGHPEVTDGASVGSAKRPVEPGDVLICKINPRINRVWQVRPRHGLPQVASPEWITVRPAPRGRIDPAFLRYYLSAPRFRDWIVGQVSGVTGSHTRAKPALVMAQHVPVPPLTEQRRIIEIRLS